jgi:hypothetical protein
VSFCFCSRDKCSRLSSRRIWSSRCHSAAAGRSRLSASNDDLVDRRRSGHIHDECVLHRYPAHSKLLYPQQNHKRFVAGLIAHKIYTSLRTSAQSGLNSERNSVVWSALIAIIESAALYLASTITFLVLTAIHSYAQFIVLESVSPVSESNT